MTDARGADRSDRSVRDDRDTSESGRRRVLLAAGASLSAALAAAGCLSNPWGPSSPGADESTTGSDGPPDTAVDTTVATGDGTATAGDDGTARDSTTTNGSTTTSDSAATETATTTEVPPEEREPDQVVEVAPDGFQFVPETFTIDAGDTVHWEWKDAGHNVRVREQPEDSDWTGTPGGPSDTYGEGYLHAHTFEAAGEYECFCAPHQTLGLEGSFTVR